MAHRISETPTTSINPMLVRYLNRVLDISFRMTKLTLNAPDVPTPARMFSTMNWETDWAKLRPITPIVEIPHAMISVFLRPRKSFVVNIT
jgi:hypothetical protein